MKTHYNRFKTEMRGDTSRWATRRESKEDSAVLRRLEDRFAVSQARILHEFGETFRRLSEDD